MHVFCCTARWVPSVSRTIGKGSARKRVMECVCEAIVDSISNGQHHLTLMLIANLKEERDLDFVKSLHRRKEARKKVFDWLWNWSDRPRSYLHIHLFLNQYEKASQISTLEHVVVKKGGSNVAVYPNGFERIIAVYRV